ncbi:NAD(P)/FAD-dependent oxidoreductase [Amphiplicatus metriothermophilus]|uniref:Sulfide-quinone reductase n=1 Tax=Amphiplicatus metriothermophilus TaxID=1519374 RepID=A0A239PQ42_9PROT|nr:FAD-dependent oxidoreductase [Amphiplicatus metriothermophilus]MBB5518453.1 sulfide:quinone oxidoreductase [Amphiplicatus metriothermophilus]SNT72385.1 sulfide-quinone oxidoreductase [Amphiplicatus metriothermophilus]
MATIAILGGGLGGVMMAYEMRKEARKSDRVMLVSDRSSFQFTPSNPWVAVGWRKPEDIQIPLETPMKRKEIDFIHKAAAKVNPSENRIVLSDGEMLDYDYLVIATGPELAFDEIEGLGPKGFTQSICTTEHAARAGEAFDAFVKNPGPVVVGASQGASCFGPAYEFAFILDTELRRRKIRDRVPMTFITSEPYIGHLGLDGVGDTKSLMESELRDRHIKWIVNARIAKVERDRMSVEEIGSDGGIVASHELDFHYAMILPAFRGVEAVRDIDGLVNPRGFVLVDKHQQNETFTNVFSVGVCVAIPPVGKTPVPVGVPKTGFMIESMVAATAKNIAALIEGRSPENEATWNAVCLADFGDGGVAFVAMPQIPPRNVNWSAQGKWVHMAKGAFEKYFLRKVRRGNPEPIYEKAVLNLMGVHKLKG